MINPKKFAIYCSGNASRVIRFYTDTYNLETFFPNVVIYDGDSKDTLSTLLKIFQERLKYINFDLLNDEEKRRINTYTSQFIFRTMQDSNSEYLICFGRRILKKDIINAYSGRLINFHPSLLPAFKGLQAIDQALAANASILGNTAHYIDEKIDNGRIIIQSAMKCEDFVDYEDVLELQFPMLKIILRDILGFEVSQESIFAEIKDRKKGYLLPTNVLKI
jgi:hypothetical protein